MASVETIIDNALEDIRLAGERLADFARVQATVVAALRAKFAAFEDEATNLKRTIAMHEATIKKKQAEIAVLKAELWYCGHVRAPVVPAGRIDNSFPAGYPPPPPLVGA